MLMIVKPFLYSTDGVRSTSAAPGGDASGIPAALVPGLLKEGFLAEVAEAPEPASTDPDDAEDKPVKRGPDRPRKA